MASKSDNKKKQKPEKKTLLGMFFAREEKDKDYLPDLKAQWKDMGNTERVKFILGGIFGLILFIGALILVYFALVAIRG